MAGATGGVRVNVPHFWDQRGTSGTGGGPMKMIFASMFIILQTANFNIFNRRTDMCLLVPHIWKSDVHFFRSLRSRILVCTPALKSAARPWLFRCLPLTPTPQGDGATTSYAPPIFEVPSSLVSENYQICRAPAAEFQPNSPKNNRWPKIRRKKMRLAENQPNSKISAAAENNCG